MGHGLFITSEIWAAIVAGLGVSLALAVLLAKAARHLPFRPWLRRVLAVAWIAAASFVVLFSGLGAYFVLESPDQQFRRNFDRTIGDVPEIGPWVQSDRVLRQAIFDITRTAFHEGGWPAANWALRVGMTAFALAYADDDHLIALEGARLRVLYRLRETSPAACRQFLLSSLSAGEAPGLRRELDEYYVSRDEAFASARRRWFDESARWTPPSEQQERETFRRVARYPTPLSAAEEAAYFNRGGTHAAACTAAIILVENLLRLPRDESVESIRVMKWGLRFSRWSAQRLPGNIFSCSRANDRLERTICTSQSPQAAEQRAVMIGGGIDKLPAMLVVAALIVVVLTTLFLGANLRALKRLFRGSAERLMAMDAEQAEQQSQAGPRAVIIDDDATDMRLVVDLIQECFGASRQQAIRLMLYCHSRGQAICGIYADRAAADAAVDRAREFARRHHAHAFEVRVEPTET